MAISNGKTASSLYYNGPLIKLNIKCMSTFIGKYFLE